MSTGVWGKKASNAVRTAPTSDAQPQQQQRNQRGRGGEKKDDRRKPGRGGRGGGTNDNEKNGGRGGWRNNAGGGNTGRGGGGAGAGGDNNNPRRRGGNDNDPRRRGSGAVEHGDNNNNHHRRDRGDEGNGKDGGWQRGRSLPLELCRHGEGSNDLEKSVRRIDSNELLALRTSFLAPPLCWSKPEADGGEVGPSEHCLWDSPDRVSGIMNMAETPRQSGDVSINPTKRRARKDGSTPNGNPNDTAPAMEDCKPLEVNETTRWTSKSFAKDKGASSETQDQSEVSSDDTVLKKSLLSLNKLSLTKFDKVSDQFIDSGIMRNEKCLSGAIELIVNKAQDEPHFAAMYAGLCLKLSQIPVDFENPSGEKQQAAKATSKKNRVFKKMLLVQCQKEFEMDIETKILDLTKEIEDEDERKYHADMAKKHYLGHMRFIGELYKGDLLSVKIMLFCVLGLLGVEASSPPSSSPAPAESSSVAEVDEEKIECFSKLMATVGHRLETQSESHMSAGKFSIQEQLDTCWEKVALFAGNENKKSKGKKKAMPNISNRIKFMLQDLIEMKENGWVTRRKEETAKTIAQIHKEAAKENSNNRRGSLPQRPSKSDLRKFGSSGDVRNLGRSQSGNLGGGKPSVTDKDGFVAVQKNPNSTGSPSSLLARSLSSGNIPRHQQSTPDTRSNSRNSAKSTNAGGAFAAFNDVGRKSVTKKGKNMSVTPPVPEVMESSTSDLIVAASSENSKPKIQIPAATPQKTPQECASAMKGILKEFFVGGDMDDAVLSIHELVHAGVDGSTERGAKVVEAGVLLVLEMKKVEVDKFVKLVSRCYIEGGKIEDLSFAAGLGDPLEFLFDIAIDAPLATSHMSFIVSELIKAGAVQFDFLATSPAYFRTDCEAARFGCSVLKLMGEEALSLDTHISVVEGLMTDDDRTSFASVTDMIASLSL